MRLTACFSVLFFLLLSLSCIEENRPEKPGLPAVKEKIAQKDSFSTDDLFSSVIANGFVSPIGQRKKDWLLFSKHGGMYEAGCYSGENWHYKGKQTADQEIAAIAKGVVVGIVESAEDWQNAVLIRHRYLENAQWKTVYSMYAHLDKLTIKKGDSVEKSQVIGLLTAVNAKRTGLHFEIRKANMENTPIAYWPWYDRKNREWILEHYEDPSRFLKEHQQTFVPAKEPFLLVAVKHAYKMQSFAYGKLLKTYEIALSQSPLGHKQTEGDNKLPEGEYRIIQKTKGPFAGDYSEYLGPRFMRLNYPNNYDAANALKNKKLTAKQAAQIISANNAKKEPNKHTGLGGGIGIHGWAGDWPSDSRHLTWGCISMKNTELTALFDAVPLHTQILIFP
jgi:hypothetical protein